MPVCKAAVTPVPPIAIDPSGPLGYHFSVANVAQRQSSGFVNRWLSVRIRPLACRVGAAVVGTVGRRIRLFSACEWGVVMGWPDKKAEKARAKAQKKLLKAAAKAAKKAGGPVLETVRTGPTDHQPSAALRFAETVRGILYLILAVSMVIAVILSNEGYIITLEDIFKSLVLAWVGKIVLLVVAAALFIYGLKHLRAVR